MKRYMLVDRKTGSINEYSSFVWEFAWKAVFALGLLTGIGLTLCFR